MKKYIILLIISAIAVTTANAQTYKVIVNNGNAVTSLSKSEVSKYFLKSQKKWSSGTEVTPVDLKASSSVRERFSKEVHKKTIAQVRAFWQQSVFSGKDTPPRELTNDSQVIEFVKSNPGAIGYVSSGANTQGVKVITLN